MRKVTPLLLMVGAFLATFASTAWAADTVAPDDGSIIDLLKPVLDAFQHGSYIYAGALALIVMVAITRRYAEPRYPWLGSDAGGAVLALVGSFGASLAATLGGQLDCTWEMVWHSLEIACAASGIYTVVKSTIIRPYLVHLIDKGPAWLHIPMTLLLPLFQKSSTPPTPAQEAVAAVQSINRPDLGVVVQVTSATGTATASSPAVPAAQPIYVSSSLELPRTLTPHVVVMQPGEQVPIEPTK